MPQSERLDYLLRCLVHIVGRSAMPIETVYELVGRGNKQIEAFNLCDGSLTQIEISKKTKINQGNLSRTFKRWRSEEHTSELQSRLHLVCRLLLEKKKK